MTQGSIEFMGVPSFVWADIIDGIDVSGLHCPSRAREVNLRLEPVA